jgi:type I restriction enzyme S subunit
VWCKLGEICEINPKNNLYNETAVSFIPMALILDSFANKHTSEIRKWEEVKKGFTHFREGDVGIAKITPCFENRKSIVFQNLESGYGAGTTELHVLRPICESSLSNYIIWFVKTENFIINGINSFTGAVGQQRVGKNVIEETYFPLPPLAEQHRIVSVIESAFALIDEIENNKLSLEQIIKQTKSKVLDLAIRGKLVPQDPDDEPASALLERIRKEQKSKKSTADNSHYPFEIPESWAWEYGYECFNPMESRKPIGETFKYIDINSIDNKKHIIRDARYLDASDAPSRASRNIEVGDTLFSMVRPYLENIAYVDEDYHNCIASTGFFVCKPKQSLYPKYLYYLMLSSHVINGLNAFMKGDNSPSINNDNVTSFLYPIPPLAEQKRIVSQIEIIFNQLDEIEKAIKA